MAIETYVGKGLSFPVELDKVGRPVLKTGFELINSSIKIIITWPYLTRIFLSEFGSRVEYLFEEPNDDVFRKLVEHFVFEALSTWETRITVLEVKAVRRQPEKLDVSVTYVIKNTNLENTFVFPYYPEIIY